MSDERFNKQDLETAVDRLATMRFFPHEARASVMQELAKMCPHRTALRWVADEAVSHFSDWMGLKELRGLMCSRFDPADGIDVWCSLPGHTAADAEATHVERHLQITGKSDGYDQIGERPLSSLNRQELRDSLSVSRGEGGYVAEETQELIRVAARKMPQIGPGK